MKRILNREGHPNLIRGSKSKVILLKELILPIGGVALVRVCAYFIILFPIANPRRGIFVVSNVPENHFKRTQIVLRTICNIGRTTLMANCY